MTNNEKLIIGGAVLIGVAGYFYIKRKKPLPAGSLMIINAPNTQALTNNVAALVSTGNTAGLASLQSQLGLQMCTDPATKATVLCSALVSEVQSEVVQTMPATSLITTAPIIQPATTIYTMPSSSGSIGFAGGASKFPPSWN